MPLLNEIVPTNLTDLIISILEIVILTFLFYQLIMLIKGTRAENIAKGIGILLAASWITKRIGLYTLNWILEKVVTIVFIALPIVFQPELRKALERMGSSRIFVKDFSALGKEERITLIRTLARAAHQLSHLGLGALIVIERTINVREFIEGGILLEGRVSPELLLSIFTPPGPLHDGAIIVRGDKVVLARCFLPLTDNPEISPNLGSRHRAALGITELTDALVIVVSEETGDVSLAQSGKLTKTADEKTLVEIIMTLTQIPLKR